VAKNGYLSGHQWVPQMAKTGYFFMATDTTLSLTARAYSTQAVAGIECSRVLTRRRVTQQEPGALPHTPVATERVICDANCKPFSGVLGSPMRKDAIIVSKPPAQPAGIRIGFLTKNLVGDA
jgi:hypothetical protein